MGGERGEKGRSVGEGRAGRQVLLILLTRKRERQAGFGRNLEFLGNEKRAREGRKGIMRGGS